MSRYGVFTHCTARFSGQRDPAVVEEFLSAVNIFKDINVITDTDALRELLFLFEDYAASWWISMRGTVRTFEQATTLIRTTFAPVPDWLIFVSFFEHRQQKNELTDSFISKKRVLLSQLQMCPCETIQLNMIYALLSSSIKERVRREDINSFDELIFASREAEMNVLQSTVENNEVPNKNRCSCCRSRGHSVENCLKKKKRDEEQSGVEPVQQNQNITGSLQRQSQGPELIKKSTLFCFGCSAPGKYRANCSSCNGTSLATAAHQYMDSNSIPTITLPTTNIELFGTKVEAVFDSGAKTSVASSELKNLLTANKCVFHELLADITLTDGSITTRNVMSTKCDIFIGNRLQKINIIYLPNAKVTRTLLGMDFLEQAGIVLNMAQMYWYYYDDSRANYTFINFKKTKKKSRQQESLDTSYSRPVIESSSYIPFVENEEVLPPLRRAPDFLLAQSSSNLFEPPAKTRKVQQTEHMDDYYATLF